MMPSADRRGFDDETLMRYLLGQVSKEEAEHFEEWSITDDDFALRLSAVENDLVDAYARGDLSGETLERFTVMYLSSPKRREKVAFAQSLLRFNEKTPIAGTQAATGPAIPSPEHLHQTWKDKSSRRWFTVPRLSQWAFTAAVLVMLLVSGYLFVENERLRERVTEAGQQQAALDQRTQELQKRFSEQRSVNDAMRKELESLRAFRPEGSALQTFAVLLLPPTRGINQITRVSIPPGTDRLTVRLQLESDDFPAYRVALKDSPGSRVIWHRSDLKARAEGETKVVSVNIPAGLLKEQNYALELTGVSSQGHTELIGGYPMKVVAK